MALREFMKFLGFDVLDAALVDRAGRDMAGDDQVPEPGSGIGVDLVIESRHGLYSSGISSCATPWARAWL
jgi:hypothetical protein